MLPRRISGTPRVEAISARADSSEPSRVRYVAIALCALVCLVDGYDMVTAPISVPILVEVWSRAPADFTWLLAAAVLGMALGAVFFAPLGDRYGRRPVIVLSVFVVGVSSVLITFSSTVYELTAWRFATGLGMGVSLTNALALAGEFAAGRSRSLTIISVYSMSALGSVMGGLLAPSLIAWGGWSALYMVGGVLPLLLCPLLLIALPESPQITEKNVARRRPRRSLESCAVFEGFGRLLSPLYITRTLVLWALYFLSTFVIYLISSWLPSLMSINGWSLEVSIHAITVFGAGGIMGGLLFGWFVDRGRARGSLIAGFLVAGCAMLVLGFAPGGIGVWMLAVALLGGGMIGITYALTALAAACYPVSMRAGGIGAASATGRVGATLAPLVGGWMLAKEMAAIEVFGWMLLPIAAGTVISFCSSSIFCADSEDEV